MKKSTKALILGVSFLIIAICLLSKDNLFLGAPFSLVSLFGILVYNKEKNQEEGKKKRI